MNITTFFPNFWIFYWQSTKSSKLNFHFSLWVQKMDHGLAQKTLINPILGVYYYLVMSRSDDWPFRNYIELVVQNIYQIEICYTPLLLGVTIGGLPQPRQKSLEYLMVKKISNKLHRVWISCCRFLATMIWNLGKELSNKLFIHHVGIYVATRLLVFFHIWNALHSQGLVIKINYGCTLTPGLSTHLYLQSWSH